MNTFRSICRLSCLILLITTLTYGTVGCAVHQNHPQQKLDIIFTEKMNIKSTKPDKKYEIKKNNEQGNQPVTLMKPSNPIRAIYVSSYVANSHRMNELIRLVEQTELNAMVLDINSGIQLSTVGMRNKRPIFKPSNKKSAIHYRQVIQKLKKQHIYLIARITVFKDAGLAGQVPAWTLKQKNGKSWKDSSGTAWIDPYRQEVWDYKLDMADYVADLGFDEVQYDYIRFPDNAAKVDREVKYANASGWTKSEAIRRFLHRASVRAHKKDIKLSADVFGMVGSSNDDMGIGQSWNLIAKEVDVISPMIYPSHYSKGTWGIINPDLNPSTIVTHALKDAAKYNKKLNKKGIDTAKVRPWLQAFTASWINPHQKYGSSEIREQIMAARQAGFQSYMLWNSSSRYPVFKQ